MKIIIHGVSKRDGPDIKALRAAWTMLDSKPGEVVGIKFEDGLLYGVKRNKASVSVEKQ